ncbi:hypothetical protein L596_012917 [Steinernema carpocapsae]|uniref:F-box domain-containing protein n=1 Tax=Steinernema carpocapsae TaxID=34508 RepID=A0A4U5NYP2_STECR|nr:hypothetical protein L596_012917 [Steinernema carpocapsae]
MESVPATFIESVLYRLDKNDHIALSQMVPKSPWKSFGSLYNCQSVFYWANLEIGINNIRYYLVTSGYSSDFTYKELLATDRRFHRIHGIFISGEYDTHSWHQFEANEIGAFCAGLVERLKLKNAKLFCEQNLEEAESALADKIYSYLPGYLPFSNLRLRHSGEESVKFVNRQLEFNNSLHSLWIMGDWPQSIKSIVAKIVKYSPLKIFRCNTTQRPHLSIEDIDRVVQKWKNDKNGQKGLSIFASVDSVPVDFPEQYKRVQTIFNGLKYEVRHDTVNKSAHLSFTYGTSHYLFSLCYARDYQTVAKKQTFCKSRKIVDF